MPAPDGQSRAMHILRAIVFGVADFGSSSAAFASAVEDSDVPELIALEAQGVRAENTRATDTLRAIFDERVMIISDRGSVPGGIQPGKRSRRSEVARRGCAATESRQRNGRKEAHKGAKTESPFRGFSCLFVALRNRVITRCSLRMNDRFETCHGRLGNRGQRDSSEAMRQVTGSESEFGALICANRS